MKLLTIALLFFWGDTVSALNQFEDKAIGIQNLSFSGGGNVVESGVNSLFSNPAGLKIQTGQHLQLGVLNLSRGFSPVAAFGQRVSENITYTMGYFRDNSRGLDSLHQGVIGGFALSPGSYFSLGATIFSHAINEDIGADMNVGVIYHPYQWIRTGVTVKNLNESLLGGTQSGYETKRKFSAAVGLWPGNTISGYYDIISTRLIPTRTSHITSLMMDIGHRNKVEITGSCKLDMMEAELSAGIGVQLGFRNELNLFGLSYSIAGIPIQSYNKELVQAFSLDLYFAVFSDMKPPIISAKEDFGILRPSSPSDSQYAYFKLSAKDAESAVETWHFVICTTNQARESQEVIRSFSGKGLPPKVIKWDGRDSYKKLLEPGYYAYRLIVNDIEGNLTHTRWQIIEIHD